MKTDKNIRNSFLGVLITAAAALICAVIDYLTKEEAMYLSAAQQFFRNPPAGVEFKAMAFRAMKDAILRDGEYHARAKRCGLTVNLDDADTIQNPRQGTERQVEGKALLERAASVATPREAKIINFLLHGFALHEAAQFLKMPKAAAVSCMESFYFRARAAIG